MKKYVYSENQMLEIAQFLNSLNGTGIEWCKAVHKMADIIDNPIDTIEEKEEEQK